MHKDDQLDLARAVARADLARLLHVDNTSGQRVALADAVASGQAYFVTPRTELLVVDLDLPADATRTADRMAAFDLLVDSARSSGVPVVSVPSGRAGHQHAYLVVGGGPARARLEVWAREHDLDVRNRGVRPPASPHRLGVAPAVTNTREVARVLACGPDLAASARLAAQLCPLTLPPRIQVAVRHGYSHSGYASPSHARMALAVAIRARGGAPRLLETILRDVSSPLGQTFRRRPLRWQQGEIARLWEKAGTWIASGGRPDARPHLNRVASASATHSWAGTGGGSDVAVLEHLLRVGYQARTRVVGAALVDIAIGAGVSTDTARQAVRRLQVRGWLRVVARETAHTTRTYELLVPAGAATSSTETAQVAATDTIGDLGADVARWGAMGKPTMRVARLLAARPGVAVNDVAEGLSMSMAGVRHHLRKLVAAGLAVRRGGSFHMCAGRDGLARVAQATGRAGARARQVAAVQRQRDARAARRATLRALRFRERDARTSTAT